MMTMTRRRISRMSRTTEQFKGRGPLPWLDKLIENGVKRTAQRAAWRRQARARKSKREGK